jgi:hypothetical protein
MVSDGGLSRDLTIEDANNEYATDIRRLNNYHRIEGWSVNPMTRNLVVVCSCDRRPREITGPSNHFSDAVKRERGPIGRK